MRTAKAFAAVALLMGVCWAAPAQPQPPPAGKDRPEGIDFDKARELLRKMRSGGTLTAEERAYLERARAARRQGNRNAVPEAKPSLGLTPLPDMTAEDTYKGEDGGLYGAGRNEPPAGHRDAALAQAQKIRPLDPSGNPSEDGRIGFMSVGMSNTTQEFSRFVRMANADTAKSANVVIVDGAQGGQDVADWADPGNRARGDRPAVWETVDARLKRAGLTPAQVQVVWIKQARRSPASHGEYPEHVEEFNGHMVTLLRRLKERFPNLRIAYLSGRIYAGYARSPLNPEPFAYEYGFAIRRLIKRQIDGDADLSLDKAPLLLWGPYLWADGTAGRKGDELVWEREDFAADGTHPGDSGRRKVAELLLNFLKADPTAKAWFVGG